jgi:hypothetical protein
VRLLRSLIPATLALLLSQQAAQAFTPLHMLAIRITDLRAGYLRTQALGETGYQTRKFVAYQENLSVQQLASHGWTNGYGVQYQRGSSQIDNEIEQLTGQSGSHWMFSVMTGNTFCGGNCYRVIAFPRVGNESKAGESSGFTRIIFRQGDYVIDIAVRGTTANRANLLVLSRMVAQRIRTYG